jgi:hypothetical protein
MSTINKGLKRAKSLYDKSLGIANQLNHIITKTHNHLFQDGVTFTHTDLASMMGLSPIKPTTSYTKMQKQRLAYMAAYVTLNRALCERGLVIKSSKYYTQFHVLAKPATVTAKVDAYHNRSATLERAADTLSTNFTKYQGTWTKLHHTQVKRVAHRLQNPLI